jgi:hypothetical protein
MRTRLFALLATALLAAGISLSGATPAAAAAGGTCNENSICLYQWINRGAQVSGDRWQSSLYNINSHLGHCLNLSPAAWDNGTPVADNSGSLQWRVNQDLWLGHTILIYNWVNCNNDGGFGFWSVNSVPSSYSIDNLSTITWVGNNISPYHTITSIAVI